MFHATMTFFLSMISNIVEIGRFDIGYSLPTSLLFSNILWVSLESYEWQSLLC
jgi:hypothetical protein